MKHFTLLISGAILLLAGSTALAAGSPGPQSPSAIAQQALLVRAGGLRGRPQVDSPITVPLTAGASLLLQTRITNNSSAWWYVSAANKSGWIPENELNVPQMTFPELAAPIASPSAGGYVAAAPTPAAASNSAYKPLAFVFDLGFEFGGDNVATIYFTDGSAQDIEAGHGVTAGLGFSWMPSPDLPFDIRTTVGYKYTSSAASNADISMSRVMLAIVPSYHFNDDWWLAAGVERHLNTKFDADGLGDNINFDDATGFTLQAGYKSFALRYLGIDYQGPFAGDLDASAVGLVMTFTLR